MDINAILELRYYAQQVVFGAYLIVVLLCGLLIWYRKPLGYVLGPLLWALHGLIFYAVVLARGPGYPPNVSFTTWSLILRAHGVILVITVLTSELLDARRTKI